MRRFCLNLILIFIVCSSFAQSRWSVGAETQLGLNGKTAKETSSNSFNGTFYENAEWNTLVPAVGGGAWVQYQITPLLGLRAGVSYLNGGNKHRRRSYSEVVATGQSTLTYDQSYSFRTQQMMVPLELILELGEGKVRPFFSVGAQWSKAWAGTIFDEELVNRTEDYIIAWSEANSDNRELDHKSIQVIASIGLQLNKQMSIRLRQSWSKEGQHLGWREQQQDLSPLSPIIYCECYGPNFYRTRTVHQQLSSIQFTYLLF